MQQFIDGKPLTAAVLRTTKDIDNKSEILANLHDKVIRLTDSQKDKLYTLCATIFLVLHDFNDTPQLSRLGFVRKESEVKYSLYLKGVFSFLQNNKIAELSMDDAYNLCILFTHTSRRSSTDKFTDRGASFVKNSLGINIGQGQIEHDITGITTLEQFRTRLLVGLPNGLDVIVTNPDLAVTTNKDEEKKDSEPSKQSLIVKSSQSSESLSPSQGVMNPTALSEAIKKQAGMLRKTSNLEVKNEDPLNTAQLAVARKSSLKPVPPKDQSQEPKLSPEEIDKLSVSQRAKYFDSLGKGKSN